MRRSVTTLEPLTSDVSSIDHLVGMQFPAGTPWHSGGCHLTHITKTAQERLKGLNKELKVTTGHPNSSDPNPIHHFWDVPEQVPSMEPHPPNTEEPKDPLAMSQCHTPQDTPRGLMTMPLWVGAVSAAQGEPAYY